MKSERLIELIHRPQKTGEDDLRELASLVERYPYFQTARVLYLKALYCSGGSRFRSELKAGTIHITDHKQLFRYLNNQLPFEASPERFTENAGLTHIVDRRIQEIQGHTVVTTLGVPAYPPDPQATEQEIVELNFSQPGTSTARSGQPPRKDRQKANPSEPVISNPIVLDNIPGVVDDYAEPAPVHENGQQTETSSDSMISFSLPDKETPAPHPGTTAAEPQPMPANPHMAMDLDLDETTTEAASPALPFPQPAKQPVFDTPEIQSGGYRLPDTPANTGTVTPKPAAPRKTKKKKDELIDRFIQNDTGPLKINPEVSDTRDLSKENPYGTEELFSETLAKIYVKQRLYEKAIATYIKLSLKYPEKSVYFAHRIEEIKEIQ